MPAASLRALLTSAIDYAGLFPPAGLELEPALANHANYVRLPDSWMLNAFVLPVARFDAAKQFFSHFDPARPFSISALGPRTDNAAAFREALVDSDAAIRSLSAHNADLVSIPQLEMFLPDDVEPSLLNETQSILGNLSAFWEAPVERAERTIALLAESNAARPGRKFGFKLRTGGVTADAFPSSAQIASALVAATKHGVPIKFTAGLHHPVRLFHKSVQTKMHGFLNVLGAGVLAAEHNWSEKQTAEMLDDESPASFSFTDELFAWREWKVAAARVSVHRKLVTSLGSCSFDEPREDLRALKLL